MELWLFWLLVPPTLILLWMLVLITVLIVIDSWSDVKKRFRR
jgi:hypothetical protein